MRVSVIAAALLAACAQAIQIKAPAKGQTIDLAEGFEVKWESVSSDPTSAHLYIVNMAGGGQPFSKDLGEVDLTKGSIKVADASVPDGEGFQFNLQSVDPLNTGILAQSQQFKIKSTPKKSTTTSKPASASASASAVESSASDASEASASASKTSPSTLVSATKSSSATGTKTASTTIPTGAAASVKAGSLFALAMGILAVFA